MQEDFCGPLSRNDLQALNSGAFPIAVKKMKTPQQKWNAANKKKLAEINKGVNARSRRVMIRLYDDRPDDQEILSWLLEESDESESLASVVKRKLQKLKKLEDEGL